MKILLTGASGFLGKALYLSLKQKAEIHTLGTVAADILADLTQAQPNIKEHYNLVIHAAGKAHVVPKTPSEADDFFKVNCQGTINLLKALEVQPLQSFIFISTVAIYGLRAGNGIKEDAPLLATDPYGHSKILAEQLVQKWCVKNNVICTILRLPLVVGANPPGNLGAMIRGIKNDYYFNIDGGKAKKSMVLAEDVAKFVLKASEVGGIFNLTDGYHPSFYELSNSIADQLGKNKPLNLPLTFARLAAKFGDLIGSKAPINSDKLQKITSNLTFDDSKARAAFGWNPTPVLEAFKIN